MTVIAFVNLGTTENPRHQLITLHDLAPKPVIKAYRERSWRRAGDEHGLAVREAVETALKDKHSVRASRLIAWTVKPEPDGWQKD